MDEIDTMDEINAMDKISVFGDLNLAHKVLNIYFCSWVVQD